MKRDFAATEQARFKDKRSYICKDGREVLHGADWVARKQELIERSGGRCEREKLLHREHARWCNGYAEEPHHIKKRGNHGVTRDDRLENLVGLSHWCHAAEDSRKIMSGKVSQ